MNDIIHIKDLEVYARHGVYEEENKLGQKFLVSVTLYVDTRRAGLSDDLELSIDYGDVCHRVDALMREQTFNLIEAAAERVASELLGRYKYPDSGQPMLSSVDIEIKKPWAPIGLPLDTVSVRISRGWHRVYIALGSNMGDRGGFLDMAVERLRQDPDILCLEVADYIETEPYGVTDQDVFLNSAAGFLTTMDPWELLDRLHEIEQIAHRVREKRWGPRTLDLDIIFYDDLVMDSRDLTIPHTDMANRDFVLKPMFQLAPYLRHPVLNKTVAQMLAELDHTNNR